MEQIANEPLATAYEMTLGVLDLLDNDPIAMIVAEEIREIESTGPHSQREIAEEAIGRLRGLGQSV